MFSSADDSDSVSYAITDSASSSDQQQLDEVLSRFTTEAPAITPAPTAPVTEPDIKPETDEGGNHFVVTTPGYLSGTVVTPEIETPVETTGPVTTTTAPVTTTKPITTPKPVTTAKPVTTTKPVVNTPTPDSASLSKFLSVVIGEIGVKEKAYNNVKYNTWYYGRPVTAPSNSSTAYAWCGVFVSWCANQAGIPTSVIPVTASVDSYYSWFKSRGQYIKYSAGTPQPGDLIFIDWDKQHGSIEHVGIVVSVENGIVTTVEGNYSNKVSCNTYALNSGYIVGYARPNYN